MAFDINVWQSELRRGVIEMCLLSVLQEEEAYGYEIIEQISQRSGLHLTESTVYPMLTRLAKDGLLATRQAPSPHGPPRRYFRVTTQGKSRLKAMLQYWYSFQSDVSKLIDSNTGG